MWSVVSGGAGFALLFVGGELVVRGSVALARRLGLTPMLIGLVVVGFATSAPEMLVSVRAALAGQPGIAVGNVVGSDIANLLLILGTAALVFPVKLESPPMRDALTMTASIALVTLVALTGTLTRWQGALMAGALVAYLVVSYRMDSGGDCDERRLHEQEAAAAPGLAGRPLSVVLVALAAGLAALVAGAELLVGAAVTIARSLGVAEAVIGLTLVALGTSLPELAAGIAAARHRQTAIVVGNVVGSNLFNTLGILGLTALVRPVAVPPGLARVDLPFALLAALVLSPALLGRARLGRFAGAAMVALYAGYVVFRYTV